MSEFITPANVINDFYQLDLRSCYLRRHDYEYNEAAHTLIINDPAWGREVIGDQSGDEVFFDLFLHPAIQRLAGIEQLTLPKQFTTVPETSGFTRWEHAWGSVVFARKMIRKAEESGRTLTDQEKIELQLRTFLSDVGHSAFSHLGDWLRQGFGGPETHHDLTLFDFLKASGVNEVLRRRDIQPERVIFPPNTEDWVESPAPNLCVDRVDYAVREIIRWLDPELNSDWWLSQFELTNDNQLIMTDPQIAIYFATGFGLLTTEHWGHPVQQLQLKLFAELVNDALHDDTYMARGMKLHPRDRLYTIDADIMHSASYPRRLRINLQALMLDIGRSQRKSFALNRSKQLSTMMFGLRNGTTQPVFPSLGESPTDYKQQNWYAPHNVEIIALDQPEDAAQFTDQPTSLDFVIPRKKPRSIDPLTPLNGERVRASSYSPALHQFITEQQAALQKTYMARIYSSPQFIADTKHDLAAMHVRGDWQTDQPYEVGGLKEFIRSIGGYALGVTLNKISYLY